jgi:1-acyl-sn-glycerol-3-phosphate acyltransferase
MPQKDLVYPRSITKRLIGTVFGAIAVSFLFPVLIVINLLQTLSLLVIPISRGAFRRFNRFCANTWWGWCGTTARSFYGTQIHVTGDTIPDREHAIVITNHQQMPDINFFMFFAKSKHRLGDLKWFVKHAIKYIPGVGWGMWFLDCIFVRRAWAHDKESIKATFARINQHKVPYWIVLFAEGTRFTKEKLARSHKHAEKNKLPLTKHVLLPRPTGFAASVIGLRDGHLDAVYDVTIGYPEGVPTLWQYSCGFCREAHLHVRRYPISELPLEKPGLSEWIIERFQEKDRMLDDFYRDGAFPSKNQGRKNQGRT